MIIRALVENTSCSNDYAYEHGLSLYVKTAGHDLLFDMGKSDLFFENAVKMGVDISDIDMAVISHGHYDHGGGLKTFLTENKKAQVYIHMKAFDKHLAVKPTGETENIGLEEGLKDNKRIIFTEDYQKIDGETELFSNIRGRELLSQANKVLMMEDAQGIAEDDFSHEQDLIITENGKTVLFAGCAHNGIVNILKRYKEIKGCPADVVIGGFHLFNPLTDITEEEALLKEIGKYLRETGSVYYTCHCTGLKAFDTLKSIMGDQMRYLSTGNVLEI